MSSSFAKDCGMRVGVKLLQFFVSVYLVFALYKIGPHWILLVACLAIPIYGNLKILFRYIFCQFLNFRNLFAIKISWKIAQTPVALYPLQGNHSVHILNRIVDS